METDNEKERIEVDEMKGLEGEIDSAVDRLFVERKNSAAESLAIGFPVSEPPYESVKTSIQESSSHPSPKPLSFIKSVEKMQTQLLSLEREITKENLEKTREAVLALREALEKRPDVTSLSNFMEKLLIRMIKNDGNIRPPQIKFLLDSKETLKLLMNEETGGEINIYRQLALAGIEAKFLSLEGLEETREERPSLGQREETDKTAIPKMWEKQMEGILRD